MSDGNDCISPLGDVPTTFRVIIQGIGDHSRREKKYPVGTKR